MTGARHPRLVSAPLPDDEFYSDHGRNTYGLAYFWLFNPRRSRAFKAIAFTLPLLIAAVLMAAALVSASGVEREGEGGLRGTGIAPTPSASR